MGDLSPLHLVIVLVVALVVLGPSRLPQAGAALGRTIREFRAGLTGLADDVAVASTAPPPTPPTDRPSRPPETP
ncbi:MAG TPA: twin-arginine translocase TatA/TatE family subunit [Candidatus Limnocylindrales bacterium]|jgi:sec-independent protein translocase protein TatA